MEVVVEELLLLVVVVEVLEVVDVVDVVAGSLRGSWRKDQMGVHETRCELTGLGAFSGKGGGGSQ